ncbi:hypothetical protein TNCV_4541311 [Trichonephila clavipes]|nr:hypothetical protein TNCV_4541311 [Trichonephila clavipes]
MHPAGMNGYCGAENISRGHQKKGGVFFSVKSRNIPNKLILFESLPREKLELDIIPPTRSHFSAQLSSHDPQGAKVSFLEEWALLPQILIDTLIKNIAAMRLI